MLACIVEDDESLGALFSDTLVTVGHETKLFTTGTSFLKFLESRDPGSEPADILVLDVFLPERDAIEILQALRARKFRLPIVLVSANGEMLETIKSLGDMWDMNVAATIQKPVDIANFVEQVTNALPANAQMSNDS